MSYKKISFFYILLVILSASSVAGVGIGRYSNEKQMMFEPGLEKTFMFHLSDSLKIDAAIEGELAKYATLNDPLPGGPVRNIEVTLKLPEYLEPGVHSMYVAAYEKSESSATVGGYSSVKVGLEVFALYPGKHPSILGLLVKDVNINESTKVGLSVINHGEEAIDNAYGNISIYDPDGNLVTVLGTETKSIAPYENVDMYSGFNTALYDLKPGIYKAVGNLNYDGINHNQSVEAFFIVGHMSVTIIDSTPELFVNSTNKYFITIESEWSGNIDNVYARITLPNGESVKTPNVDLLKGDQGTKAVAVLETYVETKGLPLGQQAFNVTLYYKGLTSTSRLTPNIIDGTPPVEEKPNPITPMTIFIAISIIIILFLILYFFVFRKNRDSSSVPHSETQNSQSNDIKPPSL